MGKHTSIQWCHHTWNPWRGCSRVSEGCRFCYAETLSHRNPGVLGVWGDSGTRVVASESAWKEPLKWDREAKAAGERRRVFCASLADVFEDRPELHRPRARLWNWTEMTPHLDWLLLTKRPENFAAMLPWTSSRAAVAPNVWLGVSVEDQAAADERIPELLRTPAAVRFLSVEPLLGPVNLRGGIYEVPGLGFRGATLDRSIVWDGGIDWVIVGGESGPKARPCHPDWVRSVRDQCVAAGVPFFFKQWGEWAPRGAPVGTRTHWVHASGLSYGTGEHIRGDTSRVEQMAKVGKKASGRVLDGKVWDEFPETRKAVTS